MGEWRRTASIQALPDELILSIVGNLRDLRDLYSFLRCNRRFASIVTEVLYRVDAQTCTFAMRRALWTYDVDLAKRALDAGSSPDFLSVGSAANGYRPDSDTILEHVLETEDRQKMIRGPAHLMKRNCEPQRAFVRYLVSRGAAMGDICSNTSPLTIALNNGQIDYLRIFVDAGADVLREGGYANRLCPQLIGIAFGEQPGDVGCMETVVYLITLGLKPNPVLWHLVHAVCLLQTRRSRLNRGRVSTLLTVLLMHGADINDRRKDTGIVPLEMGVLLAKQFDGFLAKLLLLHGADPSIIRSTAEQEECILQVCDELWRETGRLFEFPPGGGHTPVLCKE